MDISTFNRIESNKNYSLHNNLLSRVSTPRQVNQVPNVLTKEITPKASCANQKSSGRCWIFAAVNMLRRQVITDKKIPESFEFSQSYVFFFDKLERMNYNLKLVEDISTQERGWDDRVIQHILKEPFGDGGQWVMFTNIANKYGLIPKDSYPESTHSSNSAGVNMVMSRMFRTFVKDYFKSKHTYSRKACLEKTWQVLVKFFGEPPTKFVWNYKVDKNIKITDTSVSDFKKKLEDIKKGNTNNSNRFFTDKSDSETLKTKTTGDEGKFRRPAKRYRGRTFADIKADIDAKEAPKIKKSLLGTSTAISATAIP